MTDVLLGLLLAASVLLATGGPVSVKDHNGTIPVVIWHGMGECLYSILKGQ